MKNQHFLLIALIGIILASSAFVFEADATDPVSNFDFDVSPLSHHVISYTSTKSAGTTFYGQFTVTNEDIEFYVVDTSGYNDIQSTGSTSDVLYNWGQISGFLSFEYVAPADETYYFIFGNYDTLISTAAVAGWLSYDNTAPTVTVDLSASTVGENQEFTITISASDNFGLDSYSVYYDDGSYLVTWYPLSGKTFSRTITTSRSDAGDYTLSVVFTDIAGLSQTVTRTIHVQAGIIPGLPDIGDNPMTTMPLIIGGFGLIAIIAGVAIFARKRRDGSSGVSVSQEPPVAGSSDVSFSQEPQDTESSAITEHEVQEPVLKERICSFCGKPTTNISAKFCKSCGVSFSDT